MDCLYTSNRVISAWLNDFLLLCCQQVQEPTTSFDRAKIRARQTHQLAHRLRVDRQLPRDGHDMLVVLHSCDELSGGEEDMPELLKVVQGLLGMHHHIRIVITTRHYVEISGPCANIKVRTVMACVHNRKPGHSQKILVATWRAGSGNNQPLTRALCCGYQQIPPLRPQEVWDMLQATAPELGPDALAALSGRIDCVKDVVMISRLDHDPRCATHRAWCARVACYQFTPL